MHNYVATVYKINNFKLFIIVLFHHMYMILFYYIVLLITNYLNIFCLPNMLFNNELNIIIYLLHSSVSSVHKHYFSISCPYCIKNL